MANSLSYDGTDLGGVSIGLVVEKFSHNFLHGTTMGNANVPGVSGIVPVGSEISPARISFQGAIQGTSKSDIKTRLDTLRAVLAAGMREDLPLVLDVEPTAPSVRTWFARAGSPMSFRYIGSNAARVVFDFLTPYPHALGDAIVQNETQGSDPDTHVVVVDSDIPTDCFIVIKGLSVATHTIIVENITTGFLSTLNIPAFTVTSTPNDFIRVVTSGRRVQDTADGGATWSNNLMAGLTGQFPVFAVGSNSIKISGISVGDVDLQYRPIFAY